MELNKKILSAYLPFDVKIQGNTHGQIETLSGIKGETLFIESSKSLYPWRDICEIKLILHPLSDIENEIEHNGKKVIVRNLIDDVRRFIDVYQYLDQSYDIELNYETSDYSITIDFFEGYKIVQILLEYHFDIFGLIPAGLAIDINTIEK
jgi:hypothetical protein